MHHRCSSEFACAAGCCPNRSRTCCPTRRGASKRCAAVCSTCFARHGYQLVTPPLLEYVESLLTGSGRDLDLRTFKLVDQLSGRTLGVRADITPQVARIDAHLLNRQGVTRLCYCGSVLHTLPAGLLARASRCRSAPNSTATPASEADCEIVRLMARALELAGVAGDAHRSRPRRRVPRAARSGAGLDADAQEELFAALQAKDRAGAARTGRRRCRAVSRRRCWPCRSCYGGVEVLGCGGARLPRAAARSARALDDLRRLAATLAGPAASSFDLAELRGYHYHSGVVFAAYCDGHPGAHRAGRPLRRGRQGVRPRASGDRVSRWICANWRGWRRDAGAEGAILAPWPRGRRRCRPTIAALARPRRDRRGRALPGTTATWREAGCDRRLVRRGTATGSSKLLEGMN